MTQPSVGAAPVDLTLDSRPVQSTHTSWQYAAPEQQDGGSCIVRACEDVTEWRLPCVLSEDHEDCR